MNLALHYPVASVMNHVDQIDLIVGEVVVELMVIVVG